MRKERRDFDFSKRAATYDKGLKGRASRRFYDLLECEMKLSDGMRLLDVGSGTGMLLARLSAIKHIDAHGIDVETHMIDAARRQFPAGTFCLAPSEKIPYPDESFDVLTACMAYHHFHDQAGFAKEASRVLKPGGQLYIADAKLPFLIRKTINGMARLLRVVGAFVTAEEIKSRFTKYGFRFDGVASSGFAQVVCFVRDTSVCPINGQTALRQNR